MLRKPHWFFLLAIGLALGSVNLAFAQETAGSFELEILPILTKHSCNSGACHGAVAGRGYFFLSLWGSDPKSDYDQIVHAFGARRVRFKSPEDSLLIAKPSGRIAHEGGERFDPESLAAKTLALWIQSGAPYGAAPSIKKLEVHAKRVNPSHPVAEYQLDANLIHQGHGTPMDVADRVSWEIETNGGVEWASQVPPTIRLVRPGRHVILARFAGQVRSVVLIAPYPTPSVSKRASGSWIDEEIDALLDQANLTPSDLIDDLTWLRRASFDLIGRMPTIEEIDRFERLKPSQRKSIVLDEMIDSKSFSSYWAYSLARWIGFRPIANDSQATIAFQKYLKDRVARRQSWKQIARELMLTTGDSHEAGAANFSRLAADPRAHAELISEVFLGVRIGCANCHNHPLDRWTQDDYHGMAGILSGRTRTRQVSFVGDGQVTNLRTKEPAIPKLPGSDFLQVQSDEQSAQQNIEHLTDWILDESEPKFARYLANRLWASMMGRGLVEPIDDFRETNPASHPQLLERLAKLLIDSDYQPAVVLRAIALSDVYARTAVDTKDQGTDPSFFSAHISKPLAPEVLYDAIGDGLGAISNENPVQTTTPRQRAIEWLDPTVPSAALDLLGRCSKPTGCKLKADGNAASLSLTQQLHWINGPLVNQAIESPGGFLHRELEQGTSNREILARMSLRLLTKDPSLEQIQRWSEQIPSDSRERKAWFEDWTWSLLSSPRFLTN